ncbi:MAG: hypothetical protein A3C53_08745 [Omnitrophica WOR_2 bacterium RIFCSPHIGHO2_02_FULL_68_15]|nr:MAG: hypothetical protein A3C53_08745 [Omnitrophica WOR_2 bacterium RIFCSPHIGHO2_02_FULL_68_15]
MRHAGFATVGVISLFIACGFAPPVAVPWPAPSWLPASFPIILSLSKDAPAPDSLVAEPLAVSLTPDTRRGVEHLLASV